MAVQHPDNRKIKLMMRGERNQTTTICQKKSNFAEFLEIIQTAIHTVHSTRSGVFTFPHQTLGDETDLSRVVIAGTAGIGEINIDELGFNTVAA
jgi:hypothetical protein